MLFFNLQLLEAKSNSDKQICEALHNLYKQKFIKKNLRDSSLIIPGLKHGNSFLINPKDLFKNNINFVYVSQYIKLAGRRSYLHYAEYGVRYLDLSYYPDINLEAFKFNYLLQISNDKIHFKFEEN